MNRRRVSKIIFHRVYHDTDDLLQVDGDGNIDMIQLEDLLSKNPRTFVSNMHGNNELGNLNDIEKIAEICQKYNAIFHSDTVQTMGHYPHDLSKLKIDFITGAAHKFHGPKGVVIACVIPKSTIERTIAILSASVPPDVKNISDGEVCKICAIVLRAFSTIVFTCRPCE